MKPQVLASIYTYTIFQIYLKGFEQEGYIYGEEGVVCVETANDGANALSQLPLSTLLHSPLVDSEVYFERITVLVGGLLAPFKN